ncbi:hypothetical protein G9A89_017646 [Geosiphon pyriformis]|nr:hypothetical protein G9A89_017646 [Geosiphon pyriformis]
MLDYLIVDNELVLDPDLVKSKVDMIMKRWTRKCKVVSDIFNNWFHQYQPLDYVFNSAFSDIMCLIGFDKMFAVVLNLPNRKAADLFGILNKLWKHYDKLVLDMLIFDVLYGDNFFVLRDMMTQSLIFAIGSVIENALEKNRELWLVLQNMHKTYNSVDRSLSGLGTFGVKAGAAVFFEDVNLGLDVWVFGLLFSIMTELQAIALALKCILSSYFVDLFMDSQAALDACKSDLKSIYLDFRNRCWIECCHIKTGSGFWMVADSMCGD